MNAITEAAEMVRRAVARAELLATPREDRLRRFNETTGVAGYMTKHGPLGGNWHPDRCKCQGDPPTPEQIEGWTDMTLRRGVADRAKGGDTTPHKHYQKPPYSCARCECGAYVPHD
jgi:hypothetical protein